MKLLDSVTMLEDMAKEANVPLPAVVKIVRLLKEAEAREINDRRSTPEEKVAIVAGVKALFERNPNLQLSSREIAQELGVRTNQGTLSLISKSSASLRLTHLKQAA